MTRESPEPTGNHNLERSVLEQGGVKPQVGPHDAPPAVLGGDGHVDKSLQLDEEAKVQYPPDPGPVGNTEPSDSRNQNDMIVTLDTPAEVPNDSGENASSSQMPTVRVMRVCTQKLTLITLAHQTRMMMACLIVSSRRR